MLHFWDENWALRVAECPCDVHFIEWVRETGLRDKTIYHFGTGGHHAVGLELGSDGSGNVVFGITASPREYEDFVQMAIERPTMLANYLAFFGDIYLANPRLMPDFDVVTLFHVAEFRSEKNDAYGALTERQMVETLLGKTRPGGYVLFYPGSYAWATAKPLVEALAAEGKIKREGAYKTLEIYRRV